MKKVAALIPARAGSVGIARKNVRLINGRPLIHYAIGACCDCDLITDVFVATNGRDIADCARAFSPAGKLRIIGRSERSATSDSPTEVVYKEFFDAYGDYDAYVLVQATNPFVTDEYLKQGIFLLGRGFDSALSVARQKRFIWKMDGNAAVPLNYDPFNRPMRQVFDGFLAENGGFYVTKREALANSGNRISGRIGLIEMPPESYFELDEESDLMIVQSLLDIAEMAEKPVIKAILTDCDGVLTDGGMYLTENGDEIKRFSAKDGVGFQLFREHGVITGIITGEGRELILRRAKKLHIDEVYMSVINKRAALDLFMDKYGLTPDEIAYIGDEINDLPVFEALPLTFAVSDAHDAVKRRAWRVLDAKGGDGAVREVYDYFYGGQI